MDEVKKQIYPGIFSQTQKKHRNPVMRLNALPIALLVFSFGMNSIARRCREIAPAPDSND